MKIIIGLGNPGEEYEGTRHNAGFLSVDYLAEQLGANYWKNECGSLIAHCKNSSYGEEILLVKPLSFMNLSGGPVKSVMQKYKVPIDNIVVIHDDMDILPGSVKVKRGGSSAGHNGLKSISSKLTSDNYLRVRAGIGRPPGRMPVVDYVLSRPKSNALDDFEESCKIASEAALYVLFNSLDKAQQTYNSKKR